MEEWNDSPKAKKKKMTKKNSGRVFLNTNAIDAMAGALATKPDNHHHYPSAGIVKDVSHCIDILAL